MDLDEVVAAYILKFDDSPPTALLPSARRPVAADVIQKAIDAGEPFASDADFYRAVGMEPPPADALT